MKSTRRQSGGEWRHAVERRTLGVGFLIGLMSGALFVLTCASLTRSDYSELVALIVATTSLGIACLATHGLRQIERSNQALSSKLSEAIEPMHELARTVLMQHEFDAATREGGTWKPRGSVN